MSSSKNKLLVTGASGFIGQNLVHQLQGTKITPVAAVRKKMQLLPETIEQVIIGSINAETNWKNALADISTVIHLAARAHILNDKSHSQLTEFRSVNTEGTLNLARQAANKGVKEFIFISSIGVNGNETTIPFTSEDTPNPVEPYAISKLEAEMGLMEIAKETNMRVVIIRPPLVYGVNAPGNFGRLMSILLKGIPLPLGAIRNKRSFVSVDNLIDLMICCINNPSAYDQVFLVSDDDDISTTELLKRMSTALGIKAYLIPVPQNLLSFLLRLLGKGAMAKSLCGSLEIDISNTKNRLSWKPSGSIDSTLNEIAIMTMNKKESK